MAATTDSATNRAWVDRLIHEVQFSAINAEESFNYTFPSSCPALDPSFVKAITVTDPESGDPVFVKWTAYNTPGAANASRLVTLRIGTVPGGSVTGAVVRVYLEWVPSGSGGIS